MPAVLLLQVAALLPPLAGAEAEDAGYAARFAAWAAAPAFALEDLEAARPTTPDQTAVLIRVLSEGAPHQVRLAALLAGGCASGSALADACWRAGVLIREEGAALGALLAPRAVDPRHQAALAWLSLQPDRPLSVRAAALGRLLEADCAGAWPVARSVLRTGTPIDEDAPWADWERSGRYELPKRTLLVSIKAWLADDAPVGYEPNAGWSVQAGQLQALEPRAVARVAATAAHRSGGAANSGMTALLDMAAAGDVRAGRALALLLPHSRAFLENAAATNRTAARILRTAPR